MTELEKAARQALEALESVGNTVAGSFEAMTALRRALEQQPADDKVAIPVGYWHQGSGAFFKGACLTPAQEQMRESGVLKPLYTRPQPVVVSHERDTNSVVFQNSANVRDNAEEPVAWAGWHKSIDDVVLFKTETEAVEWRDQYKKGFAFIEGLVRPQPAAWMGLTDEEFVDLLPLPDGTAQANVTRVEILPGVMGTEYDEVTAWSLSLLLASLPAINAKLREKNGGKV